MTIWTVKTVPYGLYVEVSSFTLFFVTGQDMSTGSTDTRDLGIALHPAAGLLAVVVACITLAVLPVIVILGIKSKIAG